jgi:hypothetical protein
MLAIDKQKAGIARFDFQSPTALFSGVEIVTNGTIHVNFDSSSSQGKVCWYWAWNFINLFLYILGLLGRRRR